ncbi:MAG: fused MFS/spermidine synthase, partial [Ilumatobacteraceae bacterium]
AARTEMLSVSAFAGVALVTATALGSACDSETAYYCVSIVADDDHPPGRTLVLDDLRHSYVDLDDPTRLEFWYVRRLVDAIDVTIAPGGAIDIVHVGGGALTVPRYVRATRPGSAQAVYEIDGDLVEIVEDQLGFEPGDDVEIVVGDGRLAIQDRADRSADVVLGDAFGGRAVPFHLTTVEFLEEVDRVLRDDGVYALNLLDGSEELFGKAEAATLAEVFAHVVVIRGPFAIQGRGGNSVIVASRRPIDADALSARLAADVDPTDGRPDEVRGEVVGGPALEAYLDGAQILTDDFAPVDHLVAGVG